MHNIKKLLAGFLCIAVVISIGGDAVFSDESADEQETVSEAQTEEQDTSDSKNESPVTEEQAMLLMTLVAENDLLSFYKNEDEGTLALKDKKTGHIWWSNPINAKLSSGKKSQKQELQSGMVLTFGEPANRSTTILNSKKGADEIFSDIPNGVQITYDFGGPGITVPVNITLEKDYLKLYVDTSKITEKDSSQAGKITTDLAFMTTFGAAGPDENGYFVIPDGSGALINFNNGKTGYKSYTGKVYGRDITAVKTTKPAVTQQVYLPMYGIVKGDSGLMVVADKGDTAASINAYVQGQNNTDYNSCYFDFEVRTSDYYLMGGDVNPLKMFEKHGILVPEIEVRYYPVSNEDSSDVDYVDIASRYRDYLISDKGVEKKAAAGSSPLYVDFFGGTLKTTPVLGIPLRLKRAVTTFSDAQEILSELKSLGTESIVVNYNDWTNANISEKISDSASPSGLLGGKSDFNKLLDYSAENGVKLYPAVDNLTFKSGKGYWTITDTAIRTSNEYSRQIEYDLAYNVENKFYKPLSLFSPASYDKMFKKLFNSYEKYGLTNISLGSATTKIYGDYGNNAVSREMAKFILEKNFAAADEKVGSILADQANAYALPYADHIINVPLSSSKFDIFDAEIPFYQIVMHGVVPYSTTPVNGDADIGKLVLQAIASGSNFHFDFTGVAASKLKDTKYDRLFYAYYKNWTADAAGCYKLSQDVLSNASDKTITEYNILSENETETVFDDGTRITVNYDDNTVALNGTVYKLSDYIRKEIIG